MRFITLHNPTDKDILDFPIEEPKLDSEENLVKRDGTIERTGKVLTWSLKAGETLKFPYYIADYLAEVYGFLEKKDESTKEVKEQKGNPDVCKGCGKKFKSPRGMALHWAAMHPEFLT